MNWDLQKILATDVRLRLTSARQGSDEHGLKPERKAGKGRIFSRGDAENAEFQRFGDPLAVRQCLRFGNVDSQIFSFGGTTNISRLVRFAAERQMKPLMSAFV